MILSEITLGAPEAQEFYPDVRRGLERVRKAILERWPDRFDGCHLVVENHFHTLVLRRDRGEQVVTVRVQSEWTKYVISVTRHKRNPESRKWENTRVLETKLGKDASLQTILGAVDAAAKMWDRATS